MKLCYISDLHLDVNSHQLGANILLSLVEVLKTKDYDVLVVGGDVSNSWKLTTYYIEEIVKRTGKEVRYVPGNHDVWLSGYENDSWVSLKNMELGKYSLRKNPIETDDWIIFGHMGWYDYGFGESSFKEEDFMYWKRRYWADYGRAVFGMGDSEVVDKIIRDLDYDIKDFDKTKKWWFVNHFVTDDRFIKWKSDVVWNNSNGFIGSRKLGEWVENQEAIKRVSFGHTHEYSGEWDLDGKEYVVSALGYVHEWSQVDVLNELEKKIKIVDV